MTKQCEPMQFNSACKAMYAKGIIFQVVARNFRHDYQKAFLRRSHNAGVTGSSPVIATRFIKDLRRYSGSG